jgi:DnaJ-class molecular chaperone
MEAIKCFRCDGNGVVEDVVENDHLVEGELPCRTCAGEGVCYECEGTGADSGALNEPEVCTVCQGSGVLQMELDTRSSNYGQRKPMQRAQLPVVNDEDLRTWLGVSGD